MRGFKVLTVLALALAAHGSDGTGYDPWRRVHLRQDLVHWARTRCRWQRCRLGEILYRFRKPI